MPVGVRRRAARQLVEDPVAAEAEPGEERDENDDEPARAAPVGGLLLEEVRRLADGYFPNDRSTLGTARSATSVISQSSAGDAPAIPATMFVGNCCCFVLYWVAVSL